MQPDLFDIFGGAAAVAPFVVVEVPGYPRGKQAHESKFIKFKVPRGKRHGFIQNYLPKTTADYQKLVADIAGVAMRGKEMIPLGSPFFMRLFIMMPIPQSWSRKKREAALAGKIWPTVKPDDDNVSKALDALNGVVWADDCQRCRSLLWKEYADQPGLIIEVYRPA